MSPIEKRPGILFGREFVPVAEVHRRSMQGAAALAAAGIGPGDSVALVLRNDIALFEASYAVGAVGAVPVPINWHGRASEVGYIVGDCGAKLVIAHEDLIAGFVDGLPERVSVRPVATPAAVREAYGIHAIDRPVSGEAWDAWIAGFEPRSAPPVGTSASMIYTSGTTGKPKGVRRELDLATPTGYSVCLPDPSELPDVAVGRTAVVAPMYHSAPSVHGLWSLSQGAFVVLMPRFDPEALLRAIDEHRLNFLQLVPTMFTRMLRLPDEVRLSYDVSSLMRVDHGAAPCPVDVKRRMIEWWGPIIHEYYGGTETGGVAGCDSQEWLAHPGTVGRPAPGATIVILDERGRPVPAGEVGEIFMRNPAVPDFTYEGRPDARKEVEHAGLITCGDLGYLDEDGYLYICDRKRDMVISGGVNIYPAEIEGCLFEMHGVADCAVFGIPDEDLGEKLAAAVQPLPGWELTADDVQSYVRSNLASFKVPSLVEFHAELPREDSGKIFKRRLRDPFWQEAGRAI